MLAADKLLLRSTVKQRAIQLREKELLLFTDNFNAVGTQSAVLAGFAMTSFAEIDLPHNAFYAQKACLHLFVTISICANLMCTASTTFVSVWGTGKALRGKDGSMDQAVDGMHNERAFIFSCFGVGLITTLLALMSAAWILMTLEVALVATLGISWCIFVIVRQARRIHAKFGLSKDDVISFADIMQSPAVPAFEAQGHAEEDENAELIPSLAMSAKVRRGTYDV
jgi:hypothetical protein